MAGRKFWRRLSSGEAPGAAMTGLVGGLPLLLGGATRRLLSAVMGLGLSNAEACKWGGGGLIAIAGSQAAESVLCFIWARCGQAVPKGSCATLMAVRKELPNGEEGKFRLESQRQHASTFCLLSRRILFRRQELIWNAY